MQGKQTNMKVTIQIIQPQLQIKIDVKFTLLITDPIIWYILQMTQSYLPYSPCLAHILIPFQQSLGFLLNPNRRLIPQALLPLLYILIEYDFRPY